MAKRGKNDKNKKPDPKPKPKPVAKPAAKAPDPKPKPVTKPAAKAAPAVGLGAKKQPDKKPDKKPDPKQAPKPAPAVGSGAKKQPDKKPDKKPDPKREAKAKDTFGGKVGDAGKGKGAGAAAKDGKVGSLDPRLEKKIGKLVGKQVGLGKKFLKHTAKKQRQVTKGIRKDTQALRQKLKATPIVAPTKAGEKAATAVGAAGQKEIKTGDDWMNFAKDQFAVSQDRQAELDNVSKSFSDAQMKISAEDRARYEHVFRPLEDKFVAQAAAWDSPERKAAAAAEAGASVEAQAATQRGANERRMQAVGINPASGAYAGVERATDLGTALGRTQAMNQARQDVDAEALQRQTAAINMGASLPGSSTAAGQVGVGTIANANNAWMQTPGIAGAGFAGSIGATQGGAGVMTDADRTALASSAASGDQALETFKATTGAKLDAADIANPGYQGAITATGNAATTAGNLFNTQADIYKTDQATKAQDQAGFGSAIGTILGAAIPLISSKKFKKDRVKVPDGRALAAVEKTPVEAWTYKEGAGDGGRHVGPYAEDMTRNTGTGDGRTITPMDVIGINMRAVQDLSKKVDRLAVGIGRQQRKAA